MDVEAIDLGFWEIGFPHAQRLPTTLWVAVATDSNLKQVQTFVTPRLKMSLIAGRVRVAPLLVGAEGQRQPGQIMAIEKAVERLPDRPHLGFAKTGSDLPFQLVDQGHLAANLSAQVRIEIKGSG